MKCDTMDAVSSKPYDLGVDCLFRFLGRQRGQGECYAVKRAQEIPVDAFPCRRPRMSSLQAYAEFIGVEWGDVISDVLFAI